MGKNPGVVSVMLFDVKVSVKETNDVRLVEVRGGSEDHTVNNNLLLLTV